ncbi:unnamed protein product [Protopolystoma xenopodis]|uniref:DEAD-box helicase OB fold domain-containing protein n=1 Tax=Protopolystoma xenopodis TaxID=117903 RepID=A0A3S4ZBV7_9PLAT|nr:unnamed protein product [Protopolystoma xenopodis]
MAQERFHHPDGDLTRLLLIYRAFKKASIASTSSVNTIHSLGQLATSTSSSTSLQTWCTQNCLNKTRLDLAVRVRIQLKALVRSSGLSPLQTCGEQTELITQAFLMAGFRDQLAVLADLSVLPAPQSSVSCASRFQHAYQLYCQKDLPMNSWTSRLLYLHPSSTLFHSDLQNPPPALLFIEAVTIANGNGLSLENLHDTSSTDLHSQGTSK